jgi:predicted RNA binding protein YcfA (HicA-like mRNA interferase family)
LKYREIIKELEDDGWILERTVGSRQQFRHPTKPGTVTVPSSGKLARDILSGTLSRMKRQAGLEDKS